MGSSWGVEGLTSYYTYVTPHISPNWVIRLLDPKGKTITNLQKPLAH
jgi:hypothetical protein